MPEDPDDADEEESENKNEEISMSDIREIGPENAARIIGLNPHEFESKLTNEEVTAIDIEPENIELPFQDLEKTVYEMGVMLEFMNRRIARGASANESIEEKIVDINQSLEQINETLEANERHIHVIPPDANVSSPIISLELTVAAFALALPVIQLIQGNQVNALSAAIGVALLVHPALSFLRRL